MNSVRDNMLAALLALALGGALAGPAAARPDRNRADESSRGGFSGQSFDRGPHGGGEERYGVPRYPHAGFSAPTYVRQPFEPEPQRYAPPRFGRGGYGGPYGAPPPIERQQPDRGWRQQEEFIRRGVREGHLAPLGSVIANIRRVTPGRQLDANLEYMGPRLVYRVRWMTTRGRRIDYFVDAATGAILSDR